MKKTVLRFLAAFALLGAAAGGAQAAACLVVTVAPIFAGYSGTTITSTGTITVTCTQLVFAQDVYYRIHFNYGANGTGTQRRMKSGNNYLNYNYTCPQNPAKVLGDGTGNTCEFTGGQANFMGVLITPHSVTGTIPGGQSVQPGIYGDSVTATVLY
ncbi:MAG: spore coat protein U domain-containing protein [Burkholderiaceae bacterium]